MSKCRHATKLTYICIHVHTHVPYMCIYIHCAVEVEIRKCQFTTKLTECNHRNDYWLWDLLPAERCQVSANGACIYIYTYMYIYTYIHIYICIYIYIYMCVCVCKRIHMCIYKNICINFTTGEMSSWHAQRLHLWIYIYIYTKNCTYIYIYVYIYLYMYIYIYICIYISLYTHI